MYNIKLLEMGVGWGGQPLMHAYCIKCIMNDNIFTTIENIYHKKLPIKI
jgi:hypothetical protein